MAQQKYFYAIVNNFSLIMRTKIITSINSLLNQKILDLLKFNLSQTSPGYTRLQWKPFENTGVGVGGGVDRNEQYLFPTMFSPFGGLSAIFTNFEIVICKLLQFGSAENLSFGKGLKHLQTTNYKRLKVMRFVFDSVENIGPLVV